ncbi:hypothetical protein [Laspinema olomoucense]|nr:hypothetical protein [Laspinema sp. D3a]MCT7991138.1 hypothetical protein [Laspinema sp. D3a]
MLSIIKVQTVVGIEKNYDPESLPDDFGERGITGGGEIGRSPPSTWG